MITNIWLKSQPNKKISYPDCYPYLFASVKSFGIYKGPIDVTAGRREAEYLITNISRIEFRP